MNFCLERVGLHSHTYHANTCLFKKFIAKFIAESSETESKQKDDFVLDMGYGWFVKKLILVLFFIVFTSTVNAQLSSEDRKKIDLMISKYNELGEK